MREEHAGDNNGQTKLRALVRHARYINACEPNGVVLLLNAFRDAGAAVLELHGRVQRRLECRPTLERACMGRSKQGTGGGRGCPWTRESGRSPAGALTMADFTGRSEHCCVGMVERRNPCRHAMATHRPGDNTLGRGITLGASARAGAVHSAARTA